MRPAWDAQQDSFSRNKQTKQTRKRTNVKVVCLNDLISSVLVYIRWSNHCLKINQILNQSLYIYTSFSSLPSDYLFFFLIGQKNDSVQAPKSLPFHWMTSKNIGYLFVQPFTIPDSEVTSSQQLSDSA